MVRRGQDHYTSTVCFLFLFSVVSFIAARPDWSLSERAHFFRYVIFSFGSYRGLGFRKSCV